MSLINECSKINNNSIDALIQNRRMFYEEITRKTKQRQWGENIIQIVIRYFEYLSWYIWTHIIVDTCVRNFECTSLTSSTSQLFSAFFIWSDADMQCHTKSAPMSHLFSRPIAYDMCRECKFFLHIFMALRSK